MRIKQIFKQCVMCASATLMLQVGTAQDQDFYPMSDPQNNGNWSLKNDVSDEFETEKLDSSKWHVQAKNHFLKAKWIGRAPSQFSLDNVRIEDGKLKLQTRWEPDFKFSDKIDYSYPDPKNRGKGRKYENITTAAVICKNSFQYGYMEIKCKAADASVTSSFWMLGNKTELDVFEFIGAPSKKGKKFIEKRYMTNIIDWTKKAGSRRTWRKSSKLDWRVADDFHVYGCEWDENYLRIYADGKLIHETSKKELGEGWVLTKPIWTWVDSETFPWDGLPLETDLPADFEIEYIRIWQKQ